jgi:hypothetical protein
MTITAHALVGGAIAAAIPNPMLGFSLALLSHPLLDIIPHWDEGWNWRKKGKIRLFAECFIDLSIGVLLTYLFFGSVPVWYLLLAIFGSILPDLLEAPYLFLGWRFRPFCWFYKMQSNIQGKVRLPWGILTQVATVALVIFILNTFTL